MGALRRDDGREGIAIIEETERESERPRMILILLESESDML